MTGRLIRQILLGASKGGLEIAGAAVLGPAWPVLRSALTPVLDRLAERLGEDPVGSPEAAQRAADAFEKDPRLEELLRSALAEGLEPLLAGQQRLDAGLQMLCRVVMENSQALQDLNRSVGSIDARLGAGVTLSDDTMERLVEATAERTAVVLEVRGFAHDEAKAVGVQAELHNTWVRRDELVAEVNRSEVDAVKKIEEGRVDEALSSLRDAQGKLAQALAETPTDIRLRLLNGYLLKAMAQAHARTDRRDAVEPYLKRAETLFRLIIRDLPADAGTRAAALNGLGNTLSERGRHAEAVPLYQAAVQMEPGYGYAWHDLFLSLVALAVEGDLRSDDLDDAWKGLLASAPGHSGLEPSHLEILRADYERWR